MDRDATWNAVELNGEKYYVISQMCSYCESKYRIQQQIPSTRAQQSEFMGPATCGCAACASKTGEFFREFNVKCTCSTDDSYKDENPFYSLCNACLITCAIARYTHSDANSGGSHL
jgi:hypothetical protein